MSEPVEGKKPFTPPHLVVYGNVQQITMAIMRTGAMDSGTMFNMNKTR